MLYDVFAFSRPVHTLDRVGRLFVRLLPRRFAANSLRSMAEAVEGGENQ